ncbi:uncharacterized protein LOC111069713 [Drosophila obscura]|uniref:uncharacterized protein LOC111069713 n=1 Tax=Drosophila obscura TaxID=7282 RepID=UPI001BB2C10E|nr:uncharacterized protein LOC111069713 [Drosophila obscura]
MGRNLNVQIDLKVLLAMSMAEGSHHGQWRMQCGNVRYAVHYALLNGLLTIRHLRRRRSSPSRKSRLAKRLRRMKKLKKPAQVTLEHGGTQTVESRVMQQTKGSQTADPVTNQRTKASQTAETMRETKGSQTSEPILSQDTKASQIPESPRMQRAEASQTSQMAMGQMTKCSQTHRMEYRTVDVDTMDLILVYSRYQQTLDPKRKSIGSQGEAPNCNTRSTQVIPHTGDNGNQTTTEFCCTGIQTVRENECVAVQTTADSRSVHTQTLDDGQEEEVLQQPQLDALNIIHHDFQSLTGLIENEMIQSINKLVEITLMEVKALRLAADRPRGELNRAATDRGCTSPGKGGQGEGQGQVQKGCLWEEASLWSHLHQEACKSPTLQHATALDDHRLPGIQHADR